MLAEVFPDESIVATLSRQLTRSHFALLLPLEAPLARAFYPEMCRTERWSVRALRKQIDSMLYERTALSRKPKAVVEAQLAELREGDVLTPEMVLKDPYILDFLGITDRYLEKDLEDAILRELEAFILELGSGFTFVARQKRIQIDDEDFYIDLLFYNRKLRRLVALDLKVGVFKAEYKGQMELYLRWLDRHERESGEETPLGIILCAGKRREQIELLELHKTGIHVAEYVTTRHEGLGAGPLNAGKPPCSRPPHASTPRRTCRLEADASVEEHGWRVGGVCLDTLFLRSQARPIPRVRTLPCPPPRRAATAKSAQRALEPRAHRPRDTPPPSRRRCAFGRCLSHCRSRKKRRTGGSGASTTSWRQAPTRPSSPTACPARSRWHRACQQADPSTAREQGEGRFTLPVATEPPSRGRFPAV